MGASTRDGASRETDVLARLALLLSSQPGGAATAEQHQAFLESLNLDERTLEALSDADDETLRAAIRTAHGAPGPYVTKRGTCERLSTLALDLLEPARDLARAGKRTGHLVTDASMICLRRPGRGLMPGTPDINVAALLLSLLPDRLVAHQVRQDVAELVAATDLRTLPSEPPRLLKRACIVEVGDVTTERLFGDTVSLGCYEVEGRRALVGLDYPDGARVAWWAPVWAGGDVASGTAVDLDDGITAIPADTQLVHQEWARDAARFLVIFGLLLDASGTPLRVEDESSRSPSKGKKKKGVKPPPAWVTRRISLVQPTPPRATSGEQNPETTAPPVDEERIAADVQVTGHLKSQRCGPGGRDRKLIYVARYDARRWTAPRPLRVIVSGAANVRVS